MILDKWQREVLEWDGNMAIRSSRQAGKSTIISIKAAEFAIKNPRKLVMIVASVERQANLLFEKTLNYLNDKYRDLISTGTLKPTKHLINLKNGSRIMSVPCGIDGHGIRGYTIDMLIFDEAAYINEAVFTAVIPSMLTTKGKIILLSTPFGKRGYFYNCFNDDNFKTWHIRWNECPRADKEFIARERERMSKLQFLQEYEAEFVDELRQFFPSDLIRSCMILQRGYPLSPSGDKFLGVDIARMGDDESTFCSVIRENDDIKMFDLEITTKTLITDTIEKIRSLNRSNDYKKIYIDDAGIGAGVYDVLLKDDVVRRKVIALNNAKKSLDYEDKYHKTLIKEDLYNNLIALMQRGKIAFLDDPEIMLSLKSVQFEYVDDGKGKVKTRIFGDYTHIAEAIVRSAWCSKEKNLNIWVRCK